MEVFKWKETDKTVFVRIRNIEEVNRKLHFLFTDQCGPTLKTKLKGTKGYDKSHTAQAIIVYGVGVHLKGEWAINKANN